MEQKHVCASICDHLPTLSANHPWLVDRNLEDDNREHILYTTRDPPSQYWCRSPSSIARHIQGCFYGWVIFSNYPRNDIWSLWNPITLKIIRLPRLILKNGDQNLNVVRHCCLSSPPDDHGSIFMVTTKKQGIAFCRLDCKRKRLKWVEMSYAKQLKSLTGYDGFLRNLTCCNGKVYALSCVPRNYWVIQIDIVVKGGETVISLLPCVKAPCRHLNGCFTTVYFLKGCCTEMFHVTIGFNEVGHVTNKTVGGICAFKLDMANLRWVEMEDLKGSAFFLDPTYDYSVFYSPTIASELGGYVHILDKCGKVIQSYDFKNKTVALSSMPTSHASLLEHRLQDDHGEIKSQQEEVKENEMVVRDDEVNGISTKIEENTESRLLNVPFDVLKMIMECCVGVEYLNFRATCKQCHLAAPIVRWSKGGRLKKYSLVSPWLMVFDNEQGLISFTDPMFGDRYFIKTPRELIGDFEIKCSMSGWLLIRRRMGPLMFFNPFTSDILELPDTPNLDTYYFSAPPTSSDCMVVGFTTRLAWHAYIHFVAREPSWRRVRLNYSGDDSQSFYFATPYGRNRYAFYNNGGLDFIYIGNEYYFWQKVLAEGPRSSCGSSRQNFLTKCDQQLLLVVVGEFGEPVEVFKLNDSIEWEKIESLGRHAIYIGGSTCLCVEAKTPEMENKIYFPRECSQNRKVVFNSLETRRYHTFNGKNMQQSFGDFMGTKHHLNPHMWIEPNWS